MKMVIAAVAALFVSPAFANYAYVEGDRGQELVDALLGTGYVTDYPYATGIVETRAPNITCTSASQEAINRGAVPSVCSIDGVQVYGVVADAVFFALRDIALEDVTFDGVTRQTREVLCHAIPFTLANQTPRCAVTLYPSL